MILMSWLLTEILELIKDLYLPEVGQPLPPHQIWLRYRHSQDCQVLQQVPAGWWRLVAGWGEERLASQGQGHHLDQEKVPDHPEPRNNAEIHHLLVCCEPPPSARTSRTCPASWWSRRGTGRGRDSVLEVGERAGCLDRVQGRRWQ